MTARSYANIVIPSPVAARPQLAGEELSRTGARDQLLGFEFGLQQDFKKALRTGNC
jgi:hypothetical protein